MGGSHLQYGPTRKIANIRLVISVSLLLLITIILLFGSNSDVPDSSIGSNGKSHSHLTRVDHTTSVNANGDTLMISIVLNSDREGWIKVVELPIRDGRVSARISNITINRGNNDYTLTFVSTPSSFSTGRPYTLIIYWKMNLTFEGIDITTVIAIEPYKTKSVPLIDFIPFALSAFIIFVYVIKRNQLK